MTVSLHFRVWTRHEVVAALLGEGSMREAVRIAEGIGEAWVTDQNGLIIWHHDGYRQPCPS